MSDKQNDELTDTTHPLYDETKDPTHPFYEGDRGDAEPSPSSFEEEPYKVGPGRPPKKHTWKKGGPSPNPKGRPRKVQTMKPDLKKFLEDALNEKVPVTKNNKEILLTKGALGIQQLVNQYAKGDRYARRDLFQYASLLGVDLQAKEIVANALGVDDQAIVDAFLLRQQVSPLQAKDDRVKAPSDLTDDDVTTSPPSDAPIKTKTKEPVEPVLDERGQPLPVCDPRYVHEMRRRNILQQEKNQGGSECSQSPSSSRECIVRTNITGNPGNGFPGFRPVRLSFASSWHAV